MGQLEAPLFTRHNYFRHHPEMDGGGAEQGNLGIAPGRVLLDQVSDNGGEIGPGLMRRVDELVVGLDLEVAGNAVQAPDQATGGRDWNDRILCSLDDRDGNIDEGRQPPCLPADRSDLIDHADRKGETTDCLTGRRIIEIGIRERAAQVSLHLWSIEIDPCKGFEFAQQEANERPERLVPSLAKLPERGEQQQVIRGRWPGCRLDRQRPAHRKASQEDPLVARAKSGKGFPHRANPIVAGSCRQSGDLVTEAGQKWRFDGYPTPTAQSGEWTHLGRCPGESVDQQQRQSPVAFDAQWEVLLSLKCFQLHSDTLIYSGSSQFSPHKATMG